jgi:hypothetical protein
MTIPSPAFPFPKQIHQLPVLGIDTELTQPGGKNVLSWRRFNCPLLITPAQIRTCPIQAYGSYLGCLTAKRTLGHG